MKDDFSASSAGNARSGPRRLHPVDWTARVGAVDDVLREMRVRLGRRSRRRMMLAGGAAFALVATACLWRSAYPRSDPAGEEDRPNSAAVSLPARQVLPDGSLVELRDGAEISVAFTASLRRVVLTRGEALFHVTKNSRRPFLVQAGRVRVQAVGTAFAVDLTRSAVEVLVTEGRVAVDRSLESGSAFPLVAGARTPTLVDAGKRFVVSALPDATETAGPGGALAISKPEMDAKLAWLVPRLDFSGAPLAEVVSMLNRYSKVTLVLGDAELGRIRLSGVIRADNVDTLVSLLQEEHGIRARRDGNEIFLHRDR